MMIYNNKEDFDAYSPNFVANKDLNWPRKLEF